MFIKVFKENRKIQTYLMPNVKSKCLSEEIEKIFRNNFSESTDKYKKDNS